MSNQEEVKINPDLMKEVLEATNIVDSETMVHNALKLYRDMYIEMKRPPEHYVLRRFVMGFKDYYTNPDDLKVTIDK